MAKSTKDPVVKRKVGKKLLKMRRSHKLPSYLSDFPLYDRALPRISNRIKKVDRHLHLVDIGANIGDTVSLITDVVEGAFLCVEGDPDYLPLLRTNVKNIENSEIVIEDSYCAETDNADNNLRINRKHGTARMEVVADGNNRSKMILKSLDQIITEHPEFKKTNLLKIDTDGFEVAVLKSGKEFLRVTHPVIFFEFDPGFYSMHHDDPLFIFDLLYKNGYHDALAYDNFGIPIKIIDMSDKEAIKGLMRMIDKEKIYYFDILTYRSSDASRYRPIFESELISSVNVLDGVSKKNKRELISAQVLVGSTKHELEIITEELNATKTRLNLLSDELNKIYSSNSWLFARLFQKIAKVLFPTGSLRRKMVDIFFMILKKIARALRPKKK